MEDEKFYCCEQMKEEGWICEVDEKKIIIQEEYSVHYIDNAKYCPWCGNELKK